MWISSIGDGQNNKIWTDRLATISIPGSGLQTSDLEFGNYFQEPNNGFGFRKLNQHLLNWTLMSGSADLDFGS